jgi:hypothetical protein
MKTYKYYRLGALDTKGKCPTSGLPTIKPEPLEGDTLRVSHKKETPQWYWYTENEWYAMPSKELIDKYISN